MVVASQESTFIDFHKSYTTNIFCKYYIYSSLVSNVKYFSSSYFIFSNIIHGSCKFIFIGIPKNQISLFVPGKQVMAILCNVDASYFVHLYLLIIKRLHFFRCFYIKDTNVANRVANKYKVAKEINARDNSKVFMVCLFKELLLDLRVLRIK